jgi:hypothetical protein
MTIIVETGDMPAGASSYASVADADARHAASTSADAWENYDTMQKEQRLVTATRRLDAMFDWAGMPYSPHQPLGFPRRNLYDASGRQIYARSVPVTLRNATIDLALWLPDDVPAAAASSGEVVQEITLGPIGIKMAAAQSGDGSAPVAAPLIPIDIILALRHLGSYVGGGGGVGRIVR